MAFERRPRRLGELCVARARQYPDRTALTDGSQTLTYGELARRARRAAAVLADRAGVVPGDRVVLSGRNRVPWVVAAFGITLAGATIVPVGHAAGARERRHALERTAPRVVLSDRPGWGVPTLPLDALAAEGAPAAPPLPSGPPVDALVMPTSGTTGTPRYVPMEHGALLRLYSDLLGRLGLRGDDVVAGIVPLAHSFGFLGVLVQAVLAGAAVRLVPDYDRDRIADLLIDERVTCVFATPTVFVDLARSGRRDVGALCRMAVTGGAELSPRRFHALCDLIGVPRRFVGYGLTEACGAVALGDVTAQRRDTLPRLAPLEDVQVRVVDPDGRELPDGAEGELLVRGYNVMRGYVGDPAATGKVLDGGWLRTGDVGRRYPDGRVSVAARLTDTVLVSGFKVQPREVERVLAEHDSVAEAVVVGVADERQGERLVACVVARPGRRPREAELVAHCRGRLSAFKVPRAVVLVEALPITPNGKLSRAAVRRLVEGEHGPR